MSTASYLIGLIIIFIMVRILMRIAYSIGSKSFTVKEITKTILKLFQDKK